MPKFSIIVPVYNVKNYLGECVDSILEQSFNDYEIILVNDGSTDGSKEICEEYSSKYKNVKALNLLNQGVSNARNAGIEIATGDYFVFVDSDDWLSENALEKLNDIINRDNRPDIIINRIKSYYTDTDNYSECEYKFDINLMKNMRAAQVLNVCQGMPTFWMAPWVFIVNRKFLLEKSLGFKSGLLHEDEEWAPRLILNSKKIAFNNNCYYCNRADRIGSITQTLNIKKEFDKIKIIDILEKESMLERYDTEEKEVLISRCSSLFAGIVGKLHKYKNEPNYKLLVKELNNKKKVLLYSKKRTHKIIYLFSNTFGIELTNKIINALGR